jgi:hypothetical protein
VVLVVEHLRSKCEAMTSNPNTAKKKKNQNTVKINKTGKPVTTIKT